MIPEAPRDHQFSADESFVLSGGLGGIGRSIANWMVERGARNLIFLSRSGSNSAAAQATVDDLTAKHCQVKVFACDVSDREGLSRVIQECKATMPPINGCVQGAMVLQVSVCLHSYQISLTS